MINPPSVKTLRPFAAVPLAVVVFFVACAVLSFILSVGAPGMTREYIGLFQGMIPLFAGMAAVGAATTVAGKWERGVAVIAATTLMCVLFYFANGFEHEPVPTPNRYAALVGGSVGAWMTVYRVFRPG